MPIRASVPVTVPGPRAAGILSVLRALFTARMLIALVMGLVSGLPLLLTGSVLQAWLSETGIALGTIGLFALVGLPYTFKFLWAPLLDRYALPVLGRRRGWLLVIQVLLIGAIIGLGLIGPAAGIGAVFTAAWLVAFFSATQDILIDAYRRESLPEAELGLGASLYVNGYRLGMLLASGGGLILADYLPFSAVYLVMAGLMLIGLITTLLAPEPSAKGRPQTLKAAVIEPFTDYFRRPQALLILLFIVLYKLGDTMAAHLSVPFYLELGFSKTEIGAVVKLFGFGASLIGALLGGVLMLRLGLYRALWVFGIFQALSTLGFAILANFGPSVTALGFVISFENLSAGMGTAALIAFLQHLTDTRFTATQYALLSSVIGIPRVLIAAPTGYLAAALGWMAFFMICAIIALPGLMVLRRLKRETTWS